MAIKKVLRAKVVVGAALTLLFGSGIVVGLAWDQTASASVPETPSTAEPEAEEEGNDGRIVDAVGLSVVQDDSVDSMVAYHRSRMRDLDAEFRPRYRAVIEDLREDVKGILTDEQRAEYNVLLDEHDAKRHSRRSGNSRQ
jgi:hypothetical protein